MSSRKITGVIKKHMLWSLLLIPFLLIMTLHLFTVSFTAGIIAAIYVLIYSIVSFASYHFREKSVVNSLINFAMSWDGINSSLLTRLSLPCAYFDTSGKIVWYNDSFSNVTGENIDTSDSIYDLFSDITPDITEFADTDEQECFFIYNDCFYRAVLNKINYTEDDNSIIVLYLYDETLLNEYRTKIEDEDIVMGLLYIDDYEETLKDCDDLQRSLLAALIERQISKNLQMLDGVYRKMEKDRYFFIFRHKYINILKENKFSILSDVRNVKVGVEDIHVTISIGLGIHADSYAKRYDYARAAIDLAVGRGGDQAVIKDGDAISYYGGNNLQKDINTKVRARVKANALNELMLAADQIYIMGHKGADVDSFGASIGIHMIARSLKRNSKIILSKNDTESIKPILNEVLANPLYNGIFIEPEDSLHTITTGTLLIVVDVNKPALTECPDLIKATKNIVVIDHHRQSEDKIQNPVLSYIEPFASSASEMITEFFQYINNGIIPNSLEADTLYSGIMIDTNNFTVQTSPRTFEAVTYLRRSSTDIARIRKRFRCEPEEYMARAQAISSATVFADHYAITAIPSHTTGNVPVIGAKVANSLLEMNNIRASFVLSEYKSRVHISARSIDDTNVQIIMEKLGGGGHSTVSAAQLDTTIEDAEAQLKEVLTTMINEGELK